MGRLNKNRWAVKERGRGWAADEQAYAVPYTNRRPWGDFSLLHTLTPERLAEILSLVKEGECPEEYLELAADIELRDPHYRSVLSTRKDAVTGLEIKVIPGGEDKRDEDLAKAVERDLVKNGEAPLRVLVRDMLDALAKGFSVNEIIWDTKSPQWRPLSYKFRDPRWFQYDKATGETLMLRDALGPGLEPLRPFKFIIHQPRLVSGCQITSGLALPALYFWMLKQYDVTSWAAFIDRFGYPIRVGKYGKKATEADITTLKRAVAAIGQDFGAVIPEAAVLDIVEAKTTGNTALIYEKMAEFCDKQISKLVLGQTMTADEGSSRAQSETHDKVREDIASSDIQQVIDTLHTQLTVPYIKFNFGDQERYPRIDIYKPDEKNIDQIIAAVEKLGPQGLTVKANEVRGLLGLSNPEEGDEVIGGRQAPPEFPPEFPPDGGGGPELNAAGTAAGAGAGAGPDGDDDLDALFDDAAGDGYRAVSDDIASAIERASNAAADFDSFQKELRELVKTWDPDKIAEFAALAAFKARAQGSAAFAGEE